MILCSRNIPIGKRPQSRVQSVCKGDPGKRASIAMTIQLGAKRKAFVFGDVGNRNL